MISLSKPIASIDDIKVSEEEIFTHFFGNINHIPCVINSPFRKDKNPSFSIFYNKSGKLLFKDFATQECWDIYGLLKKKFNCDYNTVLLKIGQEFNFKPGKTIKVTRPIKRNSNNIGINISIRDWQDYDFEFWNKYGISKEWLVFGNVYPIKDIFINKDNNELDIPAEKYAYAYAEFKDNKTTFKIYQPYSKRCKWMSSHDKSVWDLWRQLPASGDKLIITSSRKDALCLWANIGIPATCLQGETYFPKDKIINQIKERFKTVYVLLDNDETGKKFGKELSKKYDLVYTEIDNTLGVKDPSDFFKTYKRKKFIEYFNNLFN